MAARVRLKLDKTALGDVALRSDEVRAMIEARTNAGAQAAASASGEDTFPEVTKSTRWYGNYGVSARAEADTGAASHSIGSTRG